MEFILISLIILLLFIVIFLYLKTRKADKFRGIHVTDNVEELKRKFTENLLNLKEKETVEKELRFQIQEKERKISELEKELNSERSIKVAMQAKYEEAEKNIQQQKKLLEEMEKKLADTFKALSSDVLKDSNASFLELAKKTFETILNEAKGDFGKNQKIIEGILLPVKETLLKYEQEIKELEKARESAYSALKEQIDQLAKMHSQLTKETANLTHALKSPAVKGRWGEITLKRVVEVAGMSEFCDFEEQVSVHTDEGRKRPDLIVKLPGNRNIVVDAKVPLKFYMEAIDKTDERERNELLREHAKIVREYMQSLCSKSYWEQFEPAPEFVVLFLPGESFFSAALEKDRDLIEDGINSRVILATPTTLIALLRTVAYSWYQEQVKENTKKIAETGKELYDRICKFAHHLESIRDGLETAVKSFNQAVGSWETRLIPSARKFKELGTVSKDKDLPEVGHVEVSLREKTKTEEIE